MTNSGGNFISRVAGIACAIVLMTAVPVSAQDSQDPEREALEAFEAHDYFRAIKLWNLMALYDHVGAFKNLAYAYEEGLGVEPNMQEALKYYRLAARGGSVDAQAHLAALLINGVAGELFHLREGHFWLVKAAMNGHTPSQYELAKKLELGMGVPGDIWLADELYREAASKGYGPARSLLNHQRRQNIKEGWPAEDLPPKPIGGAISPKTIAGPGDPLPSSLEESIEPGHLTGLQTARNAFIAGDYEATLILLSRLSDEGLAEAQFRLGLIYLLGYGVDIDGFSAARLFKKAATAGHKLAQSYVMSVAPKKENEPDLNLRLAKLSEKFAIR